MLQSKLHSNATSASRQTTPGCVFPLFWYLLATPTAMRLILVQLVGILFVTLQGAAHPGMLVRFFAMLGRSTGVAISYNIGVMLFGGLAPFYISVVSRFTDARFVPPAYRVGTTLLSFVLVVGTRTGRREFRHEREERRRAAAARGEGDEGSSAGAVPSSE